MKRRNALLLCLLISPVLIMTTGLQAADGHTKPNVILCMADDLGWGDVGFNGNKIIKTPHLDAMAAAGLKFNRFYAGAPVCSPTRGSALTGRHPYRYGIFSANVGHIRKQEITLAELLKTEGYVTGHFGKWHLGTLTKTLRESNRGGPKGAKHFSPPWENGFDHCFSTEAKVPTWDPLLRPQTGNSRTWWDPVSAASQGKPYGTNYWSNGKRVTDPLRGDDSKIIMDRAIPFIQKAAADKKPFFTVIWFHAPHLPVVAGPDYTKSYEEHGKYAQHYYGCITALDEQVGRLRKELRTLGVADNTMLWFCSDNGPEGQQGKAPGSAGPYRGRKRSLHEGGVRVPGILEWPSKVKPGTVTDFPASTVDYFPTVMAALGFKRKEQPQPIDGVSLLPLLEGKMTQRPRPIGFQSAGQVSLVDNRFKLIRISPRLRKNKKQANKSNPTPFQLFDLIADPSETTDIASQHPNVVKQMTKTLQDWQESCRRSLDGEDYSSVIKTPSIE